jgi:hypothetical protein
MRPLVLGLAAVVLCRVAAADDVFLTSGGQLEGRIVSRTATGIVIDVGAGHISVPLSSVVRIEEGKSALDEYEERAAGLPAADATGWVALGDWASGMSLGRQAREAYSRALSVSPDDARANTALGNVKVDGRWVSEEESYRMRGYIKYEGDWITPAEHEAILRERAAEVQQESTRRQAEAADREAEARAREAEAQAQAATAGTSLAYGWGGGPVAWQTDPIAWRTNPIVTNPIGAPLPGQVVR